MSETPLTAAQLRLLLAREEDALNPKAQERLSWLLYYFEQGRSVSETCRHFGISRATFYRLLRRFDPQKPETLQDLSRRPHTIRTSVSPELVSLIQGLRQQTHQIGQEAIARQLLQVHGLQVSPSTVRRIIDRECLYFGHTPLHLRKRMQHLSAGVPAQPTPVSAAPAPSARLQQSAPVTTHCVLCWLSTRWTAIARTLLMASVIANIVFLSAFFTYAWIQSRATGQTLRETTSTQSFSTPASPPSSVSPSPLSFFQDIRDLFTIPTAEAASGIYKPISYQGKITLTSGTAPSNGSYNMRFKVFSGSTLGSPLWTETWNGSNKVTMTGGLFSIQLGSLKAMTGSVNFNTDSLYLQVEFDPANAGTYPEVFAPRRRFTAVPYALNADRLDGLDSTQFVRTDSGSTITTGTLRILSQGVGLSVTGTMSGKTIFANTSLASSGTLVVKGTSLFQNTVSVRGTLSGYGLNIMAGNSYVRGNLEIGSAANAETALEVIGTASGTRLFATSNLSSSGTLTVQNNALFRSTLTLNNVTYTFPTSDGASSGKVLKTSGAGILSWSTDLTGGAGGFGTGNVITIGDSRYVNQSGDTMTGGLMIVNGGHTLTAIDAGLLLEVAGTASGRVFHAQDRLESSGSVVISGRALANPMLRLNNTGASATILLQTRALPLSSGVASNTSATFPTVGADDSGTGTTTWNGAGSITADDGTSANASISANAKSHYLKGSSFGFAIPAGAVINGIVVEWKRSMAPANSVQDNAVRIVKGGTIGTTDKAAAGLWPTSLAYATYGTSSDLWGQTWTASDINASNFGVVLSAKETGGATGNANVDAARVTVYYTATTPVDRLWTIGGDYADAGSFKISGTGALGKGRDFLVLTGSGRVGIGKVTSPGSILSVSGAVIVNPNGNLGATAADAGLALEIIGAASGRVLHAQDKIEGSGALVVTGAVTFTALASCSSLQSASNGALSCGSGLSQSGGDNRYVNVSGDTMTGGLMIVNGGHTLTAIDAGLLLEVAGAMSGRILHAQDTLSSSGTLVIKGTSLFQSGAIIARAAQSEFLRLKDTTNSRTASLYSGSGSPYTVVSAATGSLYLDNYKGNAYLKKNGGGGNKGWLILQTGTATGSIYPDRAEMWHDQSTVVAGMALSKVQDTSQMYNTFSYQVPSANGDKFTNGFLLRGGSYTFSELGVAGADEGIIDWYIDGVLAVSGQDWYTAGNTYNLVKTATVTVTGDGYHVLRGVVNGKNASSTNYYVDITKMYFTPASDNTHTSPGADYAEYFRTSPFGASSGRPDPLPQPGELVCMDVTRNDTVTRCNGEADPNVMGIVSTNPAFVGNDRGFDGLPIPGTVLVGLIGQLPAKVIVESGAAIRPGDSLTPAGKPGYARRAQAGEPTVGVALEGLDHGEGVVNVLVARRNESMTSAAVSDRVLQTVRDLKIEDELKLSLQQTMQTLSSSGDFLRPISQKVQRQMQTLLPTDVQFAEKVRQVLTEMSGSFLAPSRTRTAALTASASSLTLRDDLSVGGTASFSGSLATRGTLTADALVSEKTLMVAGDASIGGDLYLGGMLKVASLFVPGLVKIDGGLAVGSLTADGGSIKNLSVHKFQAGSGSSIEGTLTLNGALNLSGSLRLASGSTLSLSSLTVQSALHVLGDVTVQGLATFLGDVKIQGQLTLSGRQAGKVIIPKSGTSATVRFEPPFVTDAVVTAASNDFSLWRMGQSNMTGFTIELAEPARNAITFAWISVGVEAVTGSAPSSIAPPTSSSPLLPFTVDSHGIPLTGNAIEDACLRNHTPLDQDGHPYDCNRYHLEHIWQFGALTFEWNTLIDPPILTPPEGYVAVMQHDGVPPRGDSGNTGTGTGGTQTGSGSRSGTGGTVTPTGTGGVMAGTGETVTPTGSAPTPAPPAGVSPGP